MTGLKEKFSYENFSHRGRLTPNPRGYFCQNETGIGLS